MIIFEILTQKLDSKFDSTKALINKTGRALRARQSGFCRAFVESNFESIFCVNISKISNIVTVTIVRVTIIGPFFGPNVEFFANFCDLSQICRTRIGPF